MLYVELESFNNVMNVFPDKRIAFSDETYCIRSNLTVLHWNENVDRALTSVWNSRDQRAPRQQIGKKNYKSPTYRYRDSVWDSYMNSIFNNRRRRQPRVYLCDPALKLRNSHQHCYNNKINHAFVC